MKTDRAWQVWGARDPYFAVLTHDRYRSSRLGPEDREAFFDSGRAHVAAVLEAVASLGGPDLGRRRVLDFGCGVGRLVVPFAAAFDGVTGVDVSAPMLEEARENCRRAGLGNVDLVATEAFLGSDRADYDLLHSSLVFQHIRPAQGERLLTALLARVAPDGAVAIQFMFDRSRLPRVLTWVRDRIPFGHVLAHWLRGRRADVAPMEMNPYDMNRVLHLLEVHGFERLQLQLSRVQGIGSVFVYARRSR